MSSDHSLPLRPVPDDRAEPGTGAGSGSGDQAGSSVTRVSGVWVSPDFGGSTSWSRQARDEDDGDPDEQETGRDIDGTTQARSREVVVAIDYDLEAGALFQVREQLEQAQHTDPDLLIVDLSRCLHLDAQAILVLLDTHRACLGRGRHFALRGLNPPALRLLTLAGVRDVFSYADPHTPVAS